MALRTQQVNIQFRGGLDQKTNDQLVIPSKLLRAENVEFESDTIQRRRALSELNTGAGAIQAIGAPVRGFAQNNGSVCVEDIDGRMAIPGLLYPFGSDVNGNKDLNAVRNFVRASVRSVPQVTLDDTIVVGGPASSANFDTCTDSTKSYICTAWEESADNGASYEIAFRVTSPTGAVYYSGKTSAGQMCCRPRVLWNDVRSEFAIFFALYIPGSNDYSIYAYGAGPFGTGSGFTPIFTVTGSTPVEQPGTQCLYDACAMTDLANPSSPRVSFGIAARALAATVRIDIRTVKYDYSVVSVDTSLPATVPVSMTTFPAADYSFDILYSTADNKVKGISFFGVSKVQNDITLFTGSNSTLRISATLYGGDLVLAAEHLYPSPAGSTPQSPCSTVFVRCLPNLTGGGLDTQVIDAASRIAGGFGTLRGRTVLPLRFESRQFQSVILLLDASAVFDALGTPSAAPTPAFIARIEPGNVANPDLGVVNMLPQLLQLSGDDELVVPYMHYAENTQLAGVTNVTKRAVVFAYLDAYSQLGDIGVNGLRLLAGALPLYFDGQQFFEESFHWGPEIGDDPAANGLVTIAPVATGTGDFTFPSIGTFFVAFTMVWQDAANNWHESPVAAHGSVTTTGGNLDISPVVHLPPTYRKRAQLRMYRTLVNPTDTTLYLAHTGSFYGGTEVSEANLTAGEPLYTEGGVLPNTPMPSCRQLAMFQKRVVLTSGQRVYWSKQTDPGFAPEFVSDELTYQQAVPEEYGRPVACVEQSDRLVVIGEHSIGIIYGNGPDDTGTRGQYQDMARVQQEIGCRWDAPKSVLSASEGIWFQSPYGLRLLNGSDIVKDDKGVPLGSEVDDIATSTTYRIVALSASAMQVTRFAVTMRKWDNSLVGASFLNYDQNWRQFTTFTNHDCVDAVWTNSAYYVIAQKTGPKTSIRYPTKAYWKDAVVNGGLAFYYSLVRTAWLQFGGVQGFERLQRMLLLGYNFDQIAQDILVGMRYDYYEQGFTYEVFDGAQADQHLQVNADGTKLQFRHQFWTQKCESLQMEISWRTEEGSKTGVGTSLRLTDLALLVGVKPGPYRKASQV